MDTLDGKTKKHLANTDTQGDALDGKTNKHRHKGGDAPYGKTYKHLATTESHRVGTHWTERLTIFWLPQTHRGDAQDGKTNTHTTL